MAGNMLRTVGRRMEALGLTLRVTPEALTLLAETGYDPAYGARPLRRIIRRSVEDAAAEALLSGALREGDLLRVEAEDGKITLRREGD